jgi:ubiquinone/menaquinone biosynthesis C-methylase UbiE
MGKAPVSKDEYDESWIESAWGSKRNDELLSGGELAVRPRMERALSLSNLEPGLSVLDIACGRGEFPLLACTMGAHAVGVDFSDASIEFARELKGSRRDQDEGSLEFVQADACHLPFDDGTFDRITMLDIIEHLVPEQLEQMFLEVKRLLTPDGFAVIHTLPNRWVYDYTFPLLHRISKKFPANPRGPIDSVIHVNEQDLPRLKQMFRRCGLSSSIWLEQHMAAQARWNSSNDEYGDNRDMVYPMLAGASGRLLELASLTPAKLLLSNDIFGTVWKDRKPEKATRKLALTERLATVFS